MKRLYKINFVQLLLLTFLVVFATSCEYDEIRDADYPAQKIYLPSAIDDIYLINDTNTAVGTYRYELDLENNKVLIPIGVYRSGINNNGNITVDIAINNYKVNKLISSGDVVDANGHNLELIPESAYTLPTSVSISGGQELAIMTLAIDLDYIAGQSNKRLAVAISITSNQVEVDEEKSLAVLELNTRFIVPVAKFSYAVDKNNDKKFTFTNLSTYSTSYSWDFGDGATSTSDSTVVHQFSDFSTYNVKLTVKGITGKPVSYNVPIRVWENITSTYIKNPGNPFLRSDNRSQLVGNLADWTTTDNLKTLTGGVLYGGFLREHKVNDIVHNGVMDFYGRGALVNGKIYQTTTLPAGSYRMTFNMLDFTGKNDCYFAIAQGNVMPDATEMEGAAILVKQHFDSLLANEQELFFTLSSAETITLGFVINTEVPAANQYNEVFIKSVGLYK